MKISEAYKILNAQLDLGRTAMPKNRPVTDHARQCILSTIDDIENNEMEVTYCLNCGLIVSVLLVSDGCPNCNGLDFNSNVDAQQIRFKVTNEDKEEKDE